ncbi:hydrolase 1, exosortase A system-associated [Echinimonas agarilytica]|uniref:Hydrolase 1, exosortase A system-associated n=1 Tax=Echinimonas agarilytica TaxID=1215918 RepID=A0AA41WD26_9GAMM|nr:hydrolase 1, exosortase A system-associated [Echinimonas agarilytica]MCM2681509.1 hydrolase 1, exosortase A system-associated [Echinimonas agarilytica]
MAVTAKEIAVSIRCGKANLAGIHHAVDNPSCSVVFIAGQPQTKVGPHRLFVHIARQLADIGVSSIRFDIAGWGDSTGEAKAYSNIGDSIQAIHRWLVETHPSKIPIVFFGLCDGATASIFAMKDLPVAGAILLNPYFRDESEHAKAVLNQHYLPQLANKEALMSHLKHPWRLPGKILGLIQQWCSSKRGTTNPQTVQILEAMARFSNPCLLGFSGNDFTATQAKNQLQSWLDTQPENVSVTTFENADHTFSNTIFKQSLIKCIIDFLTSNALCKLGNIEARS